MKISDEMKATFWAVHQNARVEQLVAARFDEGDALRIANVEVDARKCMATSCFHSAVLNESKVVWGSDDSLNVGLDFGNGFFLLEVETDACV